MDARTRRRYAVNSVMLGLTGVCTLLTVSILFMILGYLVWNGGKALDWDFFTQLPKSPGQNGGGMANAIVGTFELVGIATLIGVPIGVVAGTRAGGMLDNVLMTATLFGVSMPIFWLGLMLLLLFGAGLGWLPIGGLMPVGLDAPRVTGMTVIDSLIAGRADLIAASLRHLTLPAVTLATIPLAMIARVTRSEMLATATLDHVRTARAKGMTERRVILRHILRNALIPIVTVIGLQLGLLLSGAVLTETIFSLPGLGRLMVDSILSRDYPVVQAGALFIALVFVLVNLLVDLSYGLLDPRIRRS
jgi:ABC-type dipeptide/oligopeptide/nickel transport system permease component